MPSPSEFGDGATVIEATTASAAFAHGHVPGGSSRGKGVELSSGSLSKTHAHTTFAKTSDYFSEERPFVVLIGKRGVIGALEELDAQLQAVCSLLGLLMLVSGLTRV